MYFLCEFEIYIPQSVVCWAHNKRNKIASDIKLVFHSSTIAMMHGPINIRLHTGCPRRNVPDFGRVFLMLKYTDITQNTYIQIWTVTEIMAREKCGLLAVPRTVPGQLMLARLALLVQLCSRLIPKCAVSKVISVLQYCGVFMCHVKCLEP